MNVSKKIIFLLTTKKHLCFFCIHFSIPKVETVGRSPRFIGSLVSSFATIIADTTKVSLFILVQTFYNYKSTPRYATEYSFIIVSLCSKISLTHFV